MGASGRAEEAKSLLRDLLATAEDLRRPIIEANAWLALGQLEEGEAAREAVERARAVAETSGLVHVEVLGLTRLAELELRDRDLAAADEHSARALGSLEEHGDIQGPDEVVYWVRSRVLAEMGRDGEAGAAMARARQLVLQTADWIEDEDLRRTFLENVAPNPAIMASEGSLANGVPR